MLLLKRFSERIYRLFTWLSLISLFPEIIFSLIVECFCFPEFSLDVLFTELAKFFSFHPVWHCAACFWGRYAKVTGEEALAILLVPGQWLPTRLLVMEGLPFSVLLGVPSR